MTLGLIEAYLRVLNTERYQRLGRRAAQLGVLSFFVGLGLAWIVGPTGPYSEILATTYSAGFLALGVGFLVNPYTFSTIYVDLDPKSPIRLVGGLVMGVFFLGAGIYALVRFSPIAS